MLLLVGLGNPNPNNTNNRHNVGFKIIDAINIEFKLSKQKPKFKGLLTTGIIDEQKIYAIKPLTFMNSSGLCIKELIEYFKIDVKNVFVFHDDMDINLGKIKAKFGGSSAGHNGIESIDKNIGKNYSRIRIGIGRPENNSTGVEHVLDNFSNEEKQTVEEVANNIIGSLSTLIKKSFRYLARLKHIKNNQYHMVDLNLRKNYHTKAIIEYSLIQASFVKMNHVEFEYTRQLLKVSSPDELLHIYDINTILITNGHHNVNLINKQRTISTLPPKSNAIDTIGAGDAFFATFTAGLLKNLELDHILSKSCEIASYVTERKGAIIDLPKNLKCFE